MNMSYVLGIVHSKMQQFQQKWSYEKMLQPESTENRKLNWYQFRSTLFFLTEVPEYFGYLSWCSSYVGPMKAHDRSPQIYNISELMAHDRRLKPLSPLLFWAFKTLVWSQLVFTDRTTGLIEFLTVTVIPLKKKKLLLPCLFWLAQSTESTSLKICSSKDTKVSFVCLFVSCKLNFPAWCTNPYGNKNPCKSTWRSNVRVESQDR